MRLFWTLMMGVSYTTLLSTSLWEDIQMPPLLTNPCNLFMVRTFKRNVSKFHDIPFISSSQVTVFLMSPHFLLYNNEKLWVSCLVSYTKTTVSCKRPFDFSTAANELNKLKLLWIRLIEGGEQHTCLSSLSYL